jgi:hypothetical protein
MNDIIPTDYKPRSFWERKEGVTGQVVGVALVCGAGMLLYRALPAIITLLENTIYASLLGVAAVALFFVITDKRFWRLGAWAYMSAMRRLTQVFVEIDPIGIMKNYIEDLKRKLVDMNGRISRLSGMIRACKEEIRQNDQAKSGALGMVSEAKKKGLTMVAAAQSRKAGRMAEANLTYQDLLAKMELLHRVLVKYQEVSTFLIEDMTQEVSIKERKRAMAKEAYSAMKSAIRARASSTTWPTNTSPPTTRCASARSRTSCACPTRSCSRSTCATASTNSRRSSCSPTGRRTPTRSCWATPSAC